MMIFMRLQMTRRKENNRPTVLQGRWLMSFNDMITLLLAFFVLIISMSNLEVSKVKDIGEAARKVLGTSEIEEGTKKGVIEPFMHPILDTDIQREKEKTSGTRKTEGALNKRENLIRYLSRFTEMKTASIKGGVSVSLGERRLFAPGSAEILRETRPFLKSLGEILRNMDVLIRVEGNADDMPVAPDRFSSNWELSTARAVSVVDFLISEGGISPERLSAAGYADTKSGVHNSSFHDRQLNRRVDIILTFPEK
jgi:chemotaxis protein MotB